MTVIIGNHRRFAIRGLPTEPVQRRKKFGNKRTPVQTKAGEIIFDSKAEARRFIALSGMEAAGLITDLERQPRYVLEVNGQRIGTYKADFRYRRSDGVLVVEDVKGGEATRTQAYVLRRKLMRACHGIEVQEV